ncbi:MAG: EamA family transporter [Terriglobales bacterium]
MTRKFPSLAILGGFFVIYVLWGATFLAIKIGDTALPPLVLAALRFVVAGVILYAWSWLRRWPQPTMREWGGVALVSIFMFPIGYGVTFWSETRVPSGVTAVVLALVPLWVAAMEIWIFRLAPVSAKVLGGCVLGVAGVAVLVTGGGGHAALPWWPIVALVLAAGAWALGTVLIPRLPMPRAAGTSAAAQMLLGGVMLAAAAAATGEFTGLHWARALTGPALWSLAYMIFAASVLAYAVFVWLLGKVSAVQVATYALVNPVVALYLGWGWGGETLTRSGLVGSGIILAALALVLSRQTQAKPATIVSQV